MKTLIVLVGLPRSGKSTWAKQQRLPIVSKDAIRLALHGKPYIESSEPMIHCMAMYMVASLFNAGHEKVILDETNVTQEKRNQWISNEWDCKYVIFHTSWEVCTLRAINNGQPYLASVIADMYDKSDFWNMDTTYLE